MFLKSASILCIILALAPAVFAAAPDARKDANVFILGDAVHIDLPEDAPGITTQARIVNEVLEELQRVPVAHAQADFGPLPVGWYRVEFLADDNSLLTFTTAAVLEPLAAPPPDDSPIAVDIALAWLGAKDQSDWALYAHLAKLAGVRWVRDRIHWREVQSEDGAFVPHTKYDDSAAVQGAEQLQILQVFHTRPKWALAPDSNPERPRLDLAKLHAFCRGMAERFQGKVHAWEPWNEGNAGNFGGYTLDELCSLQKAAYLGFKAGDPGLTVCWNPLGGVNIDSQTRSILRNETWPYYDVYSIHSYDWPESYEELWAHAREAACGKPIWVTESDRGMTADPDSPTGDFTPEYDRRKAELVVQSYVRSLFSGSTRHFHFILGHYMEGENRTQFGLLREDHTPRPSYVALAALGRLLAGGTCLGRFAVEGQPNVHVYGFRAQPQGLQKDVLVAWAEAPADWPERGKARASWPIPNSLPVEAAYDYLGRPLDSRVPQELRPDAIFLVLPEDALKNLPLRSIPPAEPRDDSASPIVLQFDAPGHPPVQRTIGWSPEAAYEFAPGSTLKASLTVYNLGGEPANGVIALPSKLPQGWQAGVASWNVSLAPLEQQTIPLTITLSDDAHTENVWLDFRGDFGAAGRPVLSVFSRKPPA